MDMHRPSDALESVWSSKERLTEIIQKSLEDRYNSVPEFADYLDVSLGLDWRKILADRVKTTLPIIYDSVSEYQISDLQYLIKTLESALPTLENPNSVIGVGRDVEGTALDVLEELKSDPLTGADFSLFSNAINNNPQTKLHVPPTESKVALLNSVNLGLDYRGIEFVKGYITPKDYWNDIPYPGLSTPNVNIIPSTFKDTIIQGYYGYPSVTPLESLYNPLGATSVYNTSAYQDSSSYGGGGFSSGSILDQVPELFKDAITFSPISLIGESLNGYLNQPKDPTLPNYINADEAGGKNPSARPITPLF